METDFENRLWKQLTGKTDSNLSLMQLKDFLLAFY